MKAKELITLLQQVPPESTIVVRGYENGYNIISELKHVKIAHDITAPWYCGEYSENATKDAIEAIEIYGKNKNKSI
jgi:hypothetical protein